MATFVHPSLKTEADLGIWEPLVEPFAGLAFVCPHTHPQTWLNLPMSLQGSKADHCMADEGTTSSPATTALDLTPEPHPAQ